MGEEEKGVIITFVYTVCQSMTPADLLFGQLT